MGAADAKRRALTQAALPHGSNLVRESPSVSCVCQASEPAAVLDARVRACRVYRDVRVSVKGLACKRVWSMTISV